MIHPNVKSSEGVKWAFGQFSLSDVLIQVENLYIDTHFLFLAHYAVYL